MKSTRIQAALITAVTGATLLAPLAAFAEDAPAAAPEAAAPAAAPNPLTTNVGLVSDYRFRGISQTFGKIAIQGGVDYAHESGWYVGNWDSNVSETAGYPNGNLEMDFYGGFKKSIGDWGYDVGVLHYYYPGSTAAGSAGGGAGPWAVVPTGGQSALGNPHSTATNSGTVHNTEIYIAGSWKFLSLKYSHAVTDYFMIPDTKGSSYLDLSANYDLGDGWGIVGHAGHTSVHNFSEATYSDYKLGVTKDVSGYVFGATIVGTNAKGDCGAAVAGTSIQPYCLAKAEGAGRTTLDAGKTTVVLSVNRTF